MFDLNKTQIRGAVEMENLFLLLRIVKNLLLPAALVLLAVFSYNVVSGETNKFMLNNLLGATILSLSAFLLLRNLGCFFNECLKNPKRNIPLPDAVNKNGNIASYLNFKSAKYLSLALSFAKGKKLKYPNPTILLYFFLDTKNPRIIFIFSRLLIDLNGLKKSLKEKIYKEAQADSSKEEFENIFNEAANLAVKREAEEVREGDVMAALSAIEPGLKEIITNSDLEGADFENVNQWQESVYRKIRKDRRFWDYENLLKAGSMGKYWGAGYTPTLDCFSTDWTDIVRARGFEEIIGHKDKIGQVELILSKKGGNVLIVGDPGAGRKNIIHALIRRALLKQSTPEVNNNRFVEMDIISLTTNISSSEQMEKVLDQCFNEVARAGNVILVINDFHDFLGKQQKAGIVDISGIIAPYLSLPSFKTICMTSNEGLHKYVEGKPGILAQFEKVEVPEMSEEETLMVLESNAFGLEREYDKFIPYTAIKETVKVAEKYISNYPFPQKAITLLEDTVIYARKLPDTQVILPDYVDQVLSEKVQIPIGKIKSKEKEILLDLENILHKRIIAQDEAIKDISSALRRARTGVQTRKGPMGSFLFLGPTGVGKTETAKALAETYFGSEDKMVRIDMSEFQRIDDIPRLLGGENQEGILTTQVKDNPFSLVLLDEIEKAHPNVLNVFLQVLDEGYVNDNLGRKISFANTIIIATSNAGYEVILKALEEGKEMFEIKKELLDFILNKGTFRPEFVNRFDGVVVFKSLSKNDLMLIAQLQLDKINSNLRGKKIRLDITPELKQKVVDLSYDPVFGAREMKRVIQDKIENAIARALLSDSIPQGSKIRIDPKTFEISIL